MSGALGRLGRWAAIHRHTVRLASAGSAYSPRALDTRSLAAAGICLPLARSGWDPAPAREPSAGRRRRALERPAGRRAPSAAAKSLRPSLSRGKEAPDNTPRTPNNTPETRHHEHPDRNHT
jgi:hypothetical protein